MADPGRKYDYLVTHYPGDDVLQKYQILVEQLFEKAVDHLKRNMRKYPEDVWVTLCAYNKQAIMGSCNLPQPTSPIDYKVWRRWSWLLNMPPHQALHHFFLTLEEEDPDWAHKHREERKQIVKNAIVGSAPEHGRSLPGMMRTSSRNEILSEGLGLQIAKVGLDAQNLRVSGLAPHLCLQSGKLESGTDRGGPDKKTIPAGNRKSSSTKNLGLLEGFATASLSDQWFAPPVSGPSPRGRYKHGAAVVGDKMYINGGVHNGRHLDDLQVLDLKSWAWTRIEVKAGTDGTFASHSLIAWEGNKLLAVGRHVKDPLEIMQVKVFDLQTCSWSTLKIYGKPPVSRDGYSATLMGVSLIIFGGQDAKQSFSNNLHILDLETMNWGKVDTLGVPPSPRSDHVAAIHADRYFFVFGGCSHATCFNDLHVLDLQNKEWSRPAQKGEIPSPRAGHAGVTVGELWFIFGGGDHKRGVSQSVVLNMSTLVWSVIKRVQGFASLAREGLTSVLGSYNGEDVLVFFGGYDGQYTNQVDLAKL